MRVKWKGKTSFLMLTNDKTYEVIGIERGWYRLIDDSGEDSLYPPELGISIENMLAASA